MNQVRRLQYFVARLSPSPSMMAAILKILLMCLLTWCFQFAHAVQFTG